MRFSEEEYQQLLERQAQDHARAAQHNARAGQAELRPTQPTPAPKPRKADPEHQEQKALIDSCMLRGRPFNRIFAIPNGGGRSKMEGGKLKAEGVRPNVPDLMLPVPSGPYHGLFIEMKAPDGRLRPGQVEELHQLPKDGYYAAAAWGWEQAALIMNKYVRDPAALPANPLLTQTTV